MIQAARCTVGWLTLCCVTLLGLSASQGWAQLAAPSAGITVEVPADARPAGAVFAIGFLADGAARQQQQRYGAFQSYVESLLQRPVELVAFPDSRGLMLAMQRQDISYAMAPASVLAATQRLCDCIAPLGSQPNQDGSDGLFAVMLADREGPVRDAGDFPTARVSIVGEGSVLAHRVGLAELGRGPVALADDQIGFAASLSEAADLLSAGQSDAILVWSRQADGAVLFDQEPMNALPEAMRNRLRIVWRSRPVPSHSHFVHADLDPALKASLAEALLQITGSNGDAFDAIDRGSGRAFVARTLEDYEPLLQAYAYWDRLVVEE